MDEIRVDVGVNTALEVDLSGFDFTGIEKLILTVKNGLAPSSEVVIERDFREPKLYSVNITPEESRQLNACASYDFNKVLVDGRRYKMGANGKVVLRWGCGQCQTTE